MVSQLLEIAVCGFIISGIAIGCVGAVVFTWMSIKLLRELGEMDED